MTLTFNSLQFVGFFLIVIGLYYLFGLRGQNLLMLIAGTVFYASFNWRFVSLLYLSIVTDYIVGRRLGVEERPRGRRALLGISLIVQLGILGVFKYYNFFSDDVARVLRHLGLTPDFPILSVALPVGISFYTFQTLGYIITVYRRGIAPERDPITFGAFVAWFPQLVAGPIERPQTMLPQVQRRRDPPSWDLTESALVLIVQGLFKKVVIADGVAGYVVQVYNAPGAYSWRVLVVATIGFAIQVYGDFSGYSDVARGLSRLLGVELRHNFEQPFLSRNMAEFWRRWHTSLGWWFTEFVGRPLGGAGRGPVRAVFNILVIFTLIGLWHGPSWTFVVWGLYNGVLVAIWRFVPTPRRQHPMKLHWPDVPRVLATFGLFCIGAIFFRSATISDGWTTLKRILTFASGALPGPSGASIVFLMLLAVLVLDLVERRRRIAAIEATRTPARLGHPATRREAVHESLVGGLPMIPAGVALGVLVLGILIFSGGNPRPFIYFNF